MADAAIEIKNLTKRYGRSKVYALKDLSISIMPGEVYGFLGPNGAGKSTTIRTLMNFIQPTSGGATILGKDIVRDSVSIKRRVGYLSSDMPMYPSMSGEQFIKYLSSLEGSSDQSYIKELSRTFRADPQKKLGELSRGNKQKYAIIQAFMHKPDVLILDEPSSGLDPLMQEAFYGLLKSAKERGATVFMSSHLLGEVQRVCDRVGIIREGRLIAERSIAELQKDAAHTIDITFRGEPPLAKLKRLSGVEVISHDSNHVSVRLKGSLPPLLGLLSEHDVTQLEVRQLDLEELFIRFYKDEG